MRRFLTARSLVLFAVAALALLVFSVPKAMAQETTGGIEGTVTDPSGAAVPGAELTLTGTTLVGSKTADTDAKGFYHFVNLPPGTYDIKVSAKGFQALDRANLTVQVGQLPTVDLQLQLGAAESTVEVTSAAPLIDVATTHTQTNVTQDVLQNIPIEGRSYQSVIQFAPAARNEPLQGNSMNSNGTGGSSPGSTTNGQQYGYSIAGAADSENNYLINGLSTNDIIGGYSHTNLPFDFVQEVQVKTSGVEAEYGGALGGVVDAITKTGGNEFHGSVDAQYSSLALSGSPMPLDRYNPQDQGGSFPNLRGIDPAFQLYQPKKDSGTDWQPGFTLGGPILKDRLWFFVGLNPELQSYTRNVNVGGSTGALNFGQTVNTYYETARVDSQVSKNVRVWASWLNQPQRLKGEGFPNPDSTQGYYNPSTAVPLLAFSPNLGYFAQNSATTAGVDWTISPRLIATTRFGYFFDNYHDSGYPTTGNTYIWQAGANATSTDVNGNCFGPVTCSTGTTTDVAPQLVQPTGFFNAANTINYTVRNAGKDVQFSQSLEWFKSGWLGAHTFDFGYQLDVRSNNLFQRWNQPTVQLFPGCTQNPGGGQQCQDYFAAGGTGFSNCAALVGTYGTNYGDPLGSFCTGTYGYALVYDYGSYGYAKSINHGFFVQDSWNIAKGLTINAGIRFGNEYLPSETTAGGFPGKPIQFGWGDKIAPRIGVAWDPTGTGKMKVFGSYGVFNDEMKLNLAISSFGGQYWQDCAYAMMSPDYSSALSILADSSGRYCNGDSATGANFAAGSGLQPSQVIFLENTNYRGTEGVTPGLKPYRQHDSTLGFDYQINPSTAFEARWDRRRLDNVIEDAALFDSTGSEVFTIVNPGKGPNAFNSTCPTTCPPNPAAQRAYDGLELRLDRKFTNNWGGMFSYTWSRFRGNYEGLTSSDIADGGGGRNAPNNSRAFDESYFSFDSHGQSSVGPLATDRPNTFKGYGYYTLKEGDRFATTFGAFQFFYQGTPVSTYMDVGYSFPGDLYCGGYCEGGAFPVYVEGRGKWANIVQDPVTGNMTVTSVGSRRTPWYIQTDFNLEQRFTISERKVLSFSVTVPNLWNQHSVTAYNSNVDSNFFQSFIAPGGIPFYFGGPAYTLYEHPYDWKSLLNTDQIIFNSWYGKPYLYQLSRNFRFQLKLTF